MKKKVLSALLASAMVASMMAGCNSGSTTNTPASSAGQPSSQAVQPSSAAGNDAAEGKVLNIQVWNEEFANRLADHYPGFEKADPKDATKGGKIGDVTVNFIVTANKGNAYQDQLDAVLPGNASLEADKKTDIFLVEADYALKYVDADANVAMPLSELGISDADLSKQYQYTKDIVTDANGALRGASWQACSAGLIYNREMAKEVLGTDEPAKVQEFVKDWKTFNDTAAKLGEKGYLIEASVNDSFRVYSNNVTTPWVKDGKFTIDDNIMKWVDDSKVLYDAGYTTTDPLWDGSTWKGGFQANPKDTKKVFAYFGPAWFFNFSMGASEAGTIANQGGWGLTTGPQGFFWGGTWICAAQGTDNPTLVKDIILTMTTDNAVMKEIAQKDSDCVNNKEVLKELASDASGNLAILGGQNPYEMLAKGAELVDMSKTSPYDQGCNESFQTVFKDYFEGKYTTKDEAVAAFKTAVGEKYPDLKEMLK